MIKKEREASNNNFVGKSAFLVGFALAGVAGVAGLLDTMWLIVLMLFGVLIGILNITERETQPFLVSGIVLVLAAGSGMIVFSGIKEISGILFAMLAIFVPTTIIVALRNIYTVAKD
jgi:hypothetical protein